MTTKQVLILKLFGLVATIVYGYSFLWISLMYLYGGLFAPLRELGLKKSVYFEIFVVVLSLALMALIIFKMKGHTLLKLLIQDFGLIIIAFPFFALVAGYFDNDFDQPTKPLLFHLTIFILTLLTININDWLKTRSAAKVPLTSKKTSKPHHL